MKRLIRRIAVWLGLAEQTWWEKVQSDPVRLIQGAPLAAALEHRRAAA